MELLILMGLALLNGVLAMSELAVVSARRVRLRQLAMQGNSPARVALELAESPNRFLSTVQIGISLVGIFAGAFGGAALADDAAALVADIPPLEPYSGSIGLVLIVLLTTYLSLVFGELVPKRLALQYPERLAMLVAPMMRLLSILAYPVVLILSLSTNFILLILPGVQRSSSESVTEEEITLMLREGAQRGHFTDEEPELVAGVLRLDDMRISALMTPRPEMTVLNVTDDFDIVKAKFNADQHSRYPVMEDQIDNIIGVVKAREMLRRSMVGQPLALREMLVPPFFLPESTSAARALDKFREKRVHIALVVGEHGGIEGLITINDILEAIVGELDTPPEAIQRPDGSWLIDGRMPVVEFEALPGIRGALPDRPEGHYDSVGGLFVALHGDIPRAGTFITQGKWRFEVMDMDQHRVDKLLVSPVEPDED